VTIRELKDAYHRRPFVPFLIRMADGREIPVGHPDALAWSEDGELLEPLTIGCVMPGGRWEVIELALVTSLGFPPAQARGKGKGKDKGKAG
jgi:hypothetical protein